MNDNNEKDPTVTQPMAGGSTVSPGLEALLNDVEGEVRLLRAALRAGQGEAADGFLQEASRSVLERLASGLNANAALAWNLRKSRAIPTASVTAYARELEAGCAQIVATGMLVSALIDAIQLNPRRSAGLDATVARHLIELKKRMAVILREAEKLKASRL